MLRHVLACPTALSAAAGHPLLPAATASAATAAACGVSSSSSSSDRVYCWLCCCCCSASARQQQWRHYSSDSVEGKIGADPDEVAELIESSIVRPSRAEREQQQQQHGRMRLLTTRREALSLYREVLRYSNLFVWRDEHGRVWRDVIRASARQEFEAARAERDPELINRMIVTGRDAVQRTVEGFMRRRARIIEDEEQRPQGPQI